GAARRCPRRQVVHDGAGDGTEPMVIEGVEIDFDKDEGHLRLDCGEEQFAHVRDAVVAEASATEQLGPFIDGIRTIAVRRIAALRDTVPRRFGLGLRSLLVGLALIMSLAIQLIGMFAIARWLWGPRS